MELFSVAAYFLLFRETLEASIILSVMLSLLNRVVPERAMRGKMQRQVWMGVLLGLLVSIVVAAIFLSLYYTVAEDAWDKSEMMWDGILDLFAVVVITVLAFLMVRVDVWRAKWEKKLTKVSADSVEKYGKLQNTKIKYALYSIPFAIVLREGAEAMIFLGGIGLQGSGKAYPLAAVAGAFCGSGIGFILYKGGNRVAFKWYLGAITVLLLVIAAGLFAGCVYDFEDYTDNKTVVWELNCCHHDGNGIWKLLNSVIGWRDDATVGTLTGYFVYWGVVLVCLFGLRFKWKRDVDQGSCTALKVEPVASGSDPAVLV